MPRVLIHKQGENPTLESPELSDLEAARQHQLVESQISILHREGGVVHARDVVCELGWASVAAHVITRVEILDDQEATV